MAAAAAPSLAASAVCKKLAPSQQDIGGDSNFAKAVRDKDLALVKKMVACGADVNARSGEGWFALHTAAYYGPPELVNLLVAAGGKINAVGVYSRWTPLHMAAAFGKNADVVQALLNHGADKNIKDAYGKTAHELALARSGDFAPALAALLKP